MYAKSIKRLSSTEIEITDYDGHKIIVTNGLYDELINAITQDSTAGRYLDECINQKHKGNNFISKVCILVGMYTARVGRYDPEQHMFVLDKES